jgi:hypothetical protein
MRSPRRSLCLWAVPESDGCLSRGVDPRQARERAVGAPSTASFGAGVRPAFPRRYTPRKRARCRPRSAAAIRLHASEGRFRGPASGCGGAAAIAAATRACVSWHCRRTRRKRAAAARQLWKLVPCSQLHGATLAASAACADGWTAGGAPGSSAVLRGVGALSILGPFTSCTRLTRECRASAPLWRAARQLRPAQLAHTLTTKIMQKPTRHASHALCIAASAMPLRASWAQQSAAVAVSRARARSCAPCSGMRPLQAHILLRVGRTRLHRRLPVQPLRVP